MSSEGWSNWCKVSDFLLWPFNTPTCPLVPGWRGHQGSGEEIVCVCHTLWCPCLSEFASQAGTPRLAAMPVASFLLMAEWPVGLGVIRVWAPISAWPL